MEGLFSFKNKTMLITGASSGIGRQVAIVVSHFGANVILVARDDQRLEETRTQLKEGKHLIFAQDITKYEKLEEIVRVSVEKLGPIYGLVHSAGIELTLPIRNMEPSGYENLFSVNVISGFELARIISKSKYLDANGGSFIFISSVMGVVGNGGLTGYSATKGALISGSKSMAVELAKRKIRVNCISPGYIQTPMMNKMEDRLTEKQLSAIKEEFLLGLGSPEDIAHAVLFLLSDASKWITGINLIVDGGYCAK